MTVQNDIATRITARIATRIAELTRAIDSKRRDIKLDHERTVATATLGQWENAHPAQIIDRIGHVESALDAARRDVQRLAELNAEIESLQYLSREATS